MKPVLYLDIDDTILLRQNPVHNSASFFKWCVANFEVRWLTRWCPDGKMEPDQLRYLSKVLDIPFEIFPKIDNPLGFKWSKTEAIDWKNHLPWAWVENKLFSHEEPLMKSMMFRYFGNMDRWYETNLHYWDLFPDEPRAANGPDNAIHRTWTKLANDFKIPIE